MARGILSEYGRDTPKKQVARITKNGPADERDVRNYSPPQGPIGINRKGVGLGGMNHGNAGTQRRQPESHSESQEARYYTGQRSMSEHSEDEE